MKDYLGKAVNPVLVQGLTYLCKEKPEEPIVSVCVVGRGEGEYGTAYIVSCVPKVGMSPPPIVAVPFLQG